MQDQLPHFQLWPEPGDDFVPVDILCAGATRAAGWICGWYMRDAIDQSLISAQPFEAIRAGLQMQLKFADYSGQWPFSARRTFGASRHQGIEFFTVDVFVRATSQSRKLSNF